MKHTLKITNLNRVIESGLVNKIKYRLETTHGDFSEEFPSSIASQELAFTASLTEIGTPW